MGGIQTEGYLVWLVLSPFYSGFWTPIDSFSELTTDIVSNYLDDIVCLFQFFC